MTRTPFNECAELTARYDELARVAASRYGARSQATVFILYDELIALRQARLRHPDSIVVAARIADLRERIRASYRGCEFPPLAEVPVTTVRTAPLVLEFDRQVFIRRYAAAAESLRPHIITVDSPDIEPLESGRSYMYVVDDERRLLVWDRPFDLGDLVFGRNRATVDGVPVAHPMLVPDRLRVMAAGEIIFVGSPKPAFVIANTKSGHFRPPPATVHLLRAVFRDGLGLQDRDLDLFALGSPANDHQPPQTTA